MHERLWRYHGRFYGVRSAAVEHAPRSPHRQARGPFERPRTFYASPHPEPPAWVKTMRQEWRDPSRLEVGSVDQRSRTCIARSIPAHPGDGAYHSSGQEFAPPSPQYAQCVGEEKGPTQRRGREGSKPGPSLNRGTRGSTSRQMGRLQERVSFFKEMEAGREAREVGATMRPRPQVQRRENRQHTPRQQARKPEASERPWWDKTRRGAQRDDGACTRLPRT